MSEMTMTALRTDGDSDALQVPDGIETVIVNRNAERVIIPEGIEVIRVQMPPAGAMPPRAESEPDFETLDAPPTQTTLTNGDSLPGVPDSPPGGSTIDIPPPVVDQPSLRDLHGEATLPMSEKKRHKDALLAKAAEARLNGGQTVKYSKVGEEHVDFNWHGEFNHQRPFKKQAGRMCADVMCCWMGM